MGELEPYMPSPGDSKEPSQGQGPVHVPHISESVVQLLPISLYPGAAAEAMPGYFLLFGLPLAAIQASDEGDIALVVEDVYNPRFMPSPSSRLAFGLNSVDLLNHGIPFCWNEK